ncbi:MAG: hypothetical protein ABIJ33_02195 [Patescibacteria group bacterium]|nr:hypothetical protein [Patescibacteria group bacterium]
MKLIYSNYFRKRLAKRLKNDSKLRSQVSKQLKLLEFGFDYPSLKTHKLKGSHTNEYAIWITGDLRITLVLVKEGLLLTDIIKHDEY